MAARGAGALGSVAPGPRDVVPGQEVARVPPCRLASAKRIKSFAVHAFAEFAEGFAFDLTDALACQAETFADFPGFIAGLQSVYSNPTIRFE